MPRRHGQRKKGSSKQQKAVAATPTMVEDTKVAAIEEKVVAAVAAPVKLRALQRRAVFARVVESEKVEKVVSYLSSYAPTLLSIYGNVKDRLPETLKSNVEQIEQDYVVPAKQFHSGEVRPNDRPSGRDFKLDGIAYCENRGGNQGGCLDYGGKDKTKGDKCSYRNFKRRYGHHREDR